jgi:hypothetical protein
MKLTISWRNRLDSGPTDEMPHQETFYAINDIREGKTPKDYIVWLIRSSPAIAVAVNDNVVWKSGNHEDHEKIAMRAILGEPRQASELIELDYTKQEDWIDIECRKCGWLDSEHGHVCVGIDNSWLNMLNEL